MSVGFTKHAGANVAEWVGDSTYRPGRLSERQESCREVNFQLDAAITLTPHALMEPLAIG